MIIISSVLGAIMLGIGVWFSYVISRKISGPVEGFNKVLDDITHDQMSDVNLDMSASEFKQINKLQSRILSLFLAVKFSTNAYYQNDFTKALSYLNEVEDMFQNMKQIAAVGVVLNNKGEILRSHAKKQGPLMTQIYRVATRTENTKMAFRSIGGIPLPSVTLKTRLN